MRPIALSRHPSKARGFTLIEMIVVMTITGILVGIVAVFIRVPMAGIIDTMRRAGLADTADTALRRMRRDIQRALPNSVRVTQTGVAPNQVQYIEFIPTLNGGRYCAEVGTTVGVAAVACNTLDFTLADTSFDIIGPAISMTAGSSVVVYNLGIPGADAYAATNRAAIQGIAGQTVTLNAAIPAPLASSGNRFQIVDSPVSYVCDPVAGTLTRTKNYGWSANQTTPYPPVGELLASNVSTCIVNYDRVAIDRNGLLYLTLGLTQNNESVNLSHAIQINNVP